MCDCHLYTRQSGNVPMYTEQEP